MSRYATFPTQYPLELCASGKRDKARAFLEYCLDLDSDAKNTGTFYAKGWNVSTKTVSYWIRDFKEAIEKYHQYWLEKNTQNANRIYTNSSKPGKQQGNTKVINLPNESTNIVGFEQNEGNVKVTLGKSSINNKQYTSSSEEQNTPKKTHVNDGLFNTRFADLRMSTNKFLGSKEKSYEAYLRVENMFDIRVIAYSYKQYFKTFQNTDEEQTVGLAKFIDNDMHLSYLPKRIKLLANDVELVGVFKDEIFICDDGKNYELTTTRFLEKIEAKEISFVGV